jgi:hypothetical protein
MKQDIRSLFQDKEVSGTQLPGHHRQEFYDKLKASRPRKTSKIKTNYIFKVAAIIILFLAFTLFMTTMSNEVDTQIVDGSSVENQMNVIEQHYLEGIEQEWQSFIAMANDEKLVDRFRNKLADLELDYQEITLQFKADRNNIEVIESLIENLKERLQLLKDIQEHINILNQKTGTL